MVYMWLVFILFDPEGELCSYLEGLAKSSDVQAYLHKRAFFWTACDRFFSSWLVFLPQRLKDCLLILLDYKFV